MKSYYGKIYENGANKVIPLKYNPEGFKGEREQKVEKWNEEKDTYEYVTEKVPYTYYYQKEDGTEFDTDNTVFSITEKVTVTADPSVTSSSTDVDTSDVTEKTVTTHKYTYDKKKRVKKDVATTVSSSASNSIDEYNSTGNSSTGSSSSKYTDKSESSSESTSETTTTYTYDKKGRVKKAVTSDAGVSNCKSTDSSMRASSSSESTNTVDGVTTKSSSSSSTDTYPTTTTVVEENGTRTETVTSNPHVYTYSESGSDSGTGYSSSTSGTTTYTYYANGGSKSVTTGKGIYSYKDAADNYTEDFTRTYYTFDEKSKSNGNVRTSTRTYADGTKSESSSVASIIVMS